MPRRDVPLTLQAGLLFDEMMFEKQFLIIL